MSRTRLVLLGGAALAAAALTVAISLSGALAHLELDTVDARYPLRAGEPSGYVIVAIDDRTFEELGQQWPFPRSLHARVLDRIRAGEPRAVGIDIQFTEQTRPREDNALIEAVRRARGTVLATTEVGRGGATNVFGGETVLRRIGARAGYAVVPADVDGVVRHAPAETRGLEAFGLVLARAAVRGDLSAPRAGGRIPIDFAGPAGTFRQVSYSQVLQGRVAPETFRDRVVIVGPTAPSLQDVHQTGVDRAHTMSGAELQANLARTFARGAPLERAAGWLEELIAALLALLAPLAAMRLRPAGALVLGAAGALAYVAFAVAAFDHGTVLPLAAPLLGGGLGFVAATGVSAMSAAYERERVRDLFARFVPAAVVGQVLARAGGVRLGGEERVATVMFTDLRGFTAFGERLEAGEVIEVLNDYLGEMTEAVLGHGGTLVAFMGDGIFAVFGAPLDQPDHADRALACAREMAGTRLGAFNARVLAAGRGEPFRMGIGLNTGPVVSGNVGSAARLEYAAIGDTTNTAARIEAMTKERDVAILLSEATRAALREPPPDLADLGEVEIRGRGGRLRLWALGGGVDQSSAAAARSAEAP